VVHELGHGRALASPAPFARLVQLAEVKSTDTVLDVGAGTGYSTAVLARLAASVTGPESEPAVAGKARELLAELGVANADVAEGALNGTGLPRQAYNVIIVEGAVTEEPTGLFPLLEDGGRLVALLRRGGPGVAHLYVKSGKDVAARAEFDAALPPLGHAPREDVFVF
jgi:protein-L-isoaspartate(D-aspartate) O-methyltransferase